MSAATALSLRKQRRELSERMSACLDSKSLSAMAEWRALDAQQDKLGQEIQRIEQDILERAESAELTHNKEKLMNAKGAAAKSWDWASSWGGPPAGAIAAAVSFAGVMAFERGGEIPGSGAIPIIAHSGESVVTKALTDQVKNSYGRGGSGGHTFNFSPVINAIDGDGVEKMLKKHSDRFARHVTAELRKQNKR